MAYKDNMDKIQFRNCAECPNQTCAESRARQNKGNYNSFNPTDFCPMVEKENREEYKANIEGYDNMSEKEKHIAELEYTLKKYMVKKYVDTRKYKMNLMSKDKYDFYIGIYNLVIGMMSERLKKETGNSNYKNLVKVEF